MCVCVSLCLCQLQFPTSYWEQLWSLNQRRVFFLFWQLRIKLKTQINSAGLTLGVLRTTLFIMTVISFRCLMKQMKLRDRIIHFFLESWFYANLNQITKFRPRFCALHCLSFLTAHKTSKSEELEREAGDWCNNKSTRHTADPARKQIRNGMAPLETNSNPWLKKKTSDE